MTDYQGLLADEENRLRENSLADGYADIIDGDGIAVRANVVAARQVNPDEYGRALQLSRETGVPAPVAARNLPRVEREATVDRYAAFLDGAPVTREAVVERPDFAALAHDDFEQLSIVEQVAREFVRQGRALASGVPRVSQGIYGALSAVPGTLRQLAQPLVAAGLVPSNPFAGVEDFVLDVARGQRQLADTVAGPRDPNTSLVERGIRAGVESLGTTAPAVVAGVVTRNPQAALTIMAATTGGQAYVEARDAGLAPAAAVPYAATQAAIEFLTEKIPVGRLLADLNADTGLVQLVTRQLATEIPGEQVATLLQDLNEWAVLHPDKPFSAYVDERGTAALETLIATIVGVGGNVAVARALDRVTERTAAAEAAKREAKLLEALSQASVASKLRARDPASFEDFVQRAVASEGGLPDTVFVAPGILAEALDATRTDPASLPATIVAQAAEARASGADVAIPLSVYASRLAGTPLGKRLLPHLRTDPTRPSSVEPVDPAAEVAAMLAPRAGLFADAAQAGMTAAEWAALQNDREQGALDQRDRRALRDLRWLSNRKLEAIRELRADARAKREALRAEVAPTVEAQPVFRAQRFLRDGTLPDGTTLTEVGSTKFSAEALAAMYGDGPATPRRYLPTNLVTTEGGLHPDAVAELFGFTSGDHLVRALVAAGKVGDAIEAATEQAMLERFGDIASPEALERAAEASIAHEARARAMGRELAALQRATGSWPQLVQAARAFAEQAVGAKKVRDLRPGLHVVAETRANRESMQAFRRGDTALAARLKRQALVANRLHRATVDAKDDVDSGLAYLKRLDTDAARKAIGPDYSEQIDALLERFELRKLTNKDVDRRKSLAAWIEQQEKAGLTPDIDEALVEEARRTSYKDLTVDEFRGLVASVQNIEHLGRLKQTLLTARDKRAFDAVVADVAASLRANANRTVEQPIERLPGDYAKDLVAGYFAEHRKLASYVREMDGFADGGVLWQRFLRPLNEAAAQEAVDREQATLRLAELLKPLHAAGSLRTRVHIPAIGRSLSREARIAVALNVGNPVNKQRVMDGYGWSPAQLQAVLDTLGEADWRFVQGVWDTLESYWPRIAAKEERVSGVAPERVQPEPVATPWGELRGGYYPIKYDPNQSSIADAHADAELLKQKLAGVYARATTRRGHTKARAEDVKRPVHLSLGVLTSHLNGVIHDLAWHEPLIDTTRLLNAKPIEQAIRDHYGPTVLKQFRDALSDIAVGDLPAQSAFERFMGRVRAGVSISAMGWSVMTAAMQPLGLTQSIVRIGPRWVGKGVARWLGDATKMENTVAWIHEKSEFMRLRDKTFNRELNEIANQIRGDGGTAKAALEASYFYLLQKVQLAADVPTWLGAYEKALALNTKDEATAVQLADQAVLDAQGGGTIKDLAAIQRGTALKLVFTSFYSFFNTTFNLTAESARRTRWTKPGSVGHFAVDMLLLYTLPAVLGMLLKDALKGGDDEDELAERLVREQLSYLSGTMIGVRELSGAIQGFGSYSGPAGARFYADMTRLLTQIQQGEADEGFFRALNSAAGVLLHYPALQVDRTWRGLNAIIDEDAPLSALLFGPPPK